MERTMSSKKRDAKDKQCDDVKDVRVCVCGGGGGTKHIDKFLKSFGSGPMHRKSARIVGIDSGVRSIRRRNTRSRCLQAPHAEFKTTATGDVFS